jgi:hypothetical protein
MKRSKLKFEVADDGSIIGKDGKVLFFSLERFKKDIIEGDCCFICGCSRGSRKFNDEHVIPDWLLRQFDLHSHQIGLPNSFGLRYSKYKIPCCGSCNSLLGKTLETPISKLFKSGYASVLKHAKRRGIWLFYLWLCLLYFKTHFKDRTLRFAIDRRKNEGAIADRYDWNTSPGLRGTSYPGSTSQQHFQPQRGCGSLRTVTNFHASGVRHIRHE